MSFLFISGRRGRWRALACGAVAPMAVAQTPAPTALETVVVTASRSEQRLADALPHTTVITRDDIERAQAVDLLDLLATQAGVEVARSGGFGSQASIFMRGTNSSQTLVLVDGIRLNAAVGAAAALGGIGLDGIERIEIVRGNLSSLYGSEAIGGVIQVFTRGGAPTGASARVEAGTGHSRAASAAANARWSGSDLGATDLAVSAGYSKARPFSAIDAARVQTSAFTLGANPDLDANRNRTGSLRVKQALGAKAEVGASLWTSRNDTDFDSTSDGPTATHREISHQDVWQANGKVTPLERWTARLRLGEARDVSRNVVASDSPSFSAGEFQASNRQLALDNVVTVAPAVDALFGAELLRQHGASSSYDPNFASAVVAFDRRVRAFWAGALAQPGAHRLQLNVRRDDYSDVGGATTGLASYAYQLTPQLSAGVQYSTAFRAPSFNDLYFPGFSNVDLQPERARSVEGSLRYAAGATTVRLALYRTRTSDLIVFDAATSKPQNIARAKIDGGELAAGTRIADVRIDLTFDASRPVDAETGQRLLRRAPWRATLAASREIGAAEVGAAVSHVASRYDSDINTFARVGLKSYTLVRATVAYKVGNHVRLTLRGENLTDERYELVSGYNTQRRSVFAGMEARL